MDEESKREYGRGWTTEESSRRAGDDERAEVDSIEQDMERLLRDVHGGGLGGGAESSSSLLRRGESSLGRYVVLEVIGAGGMGTVLKAYDDQLDRAIAVKLLHPGAARRHAGRLRREAQALAKLSHPNVVHVYEVGEADGQWYIAMEFVPGVTLRRWQDERRGWRACVEVYVQAGAGLAAAHREGLIHRDFKPDNCIIDEHGRPRVLDFGLARDAELVCSDPSLGSVDEASGEAEVTLTEAGAIMGTPAYMSMEQLRGHPADERSDQFGFCASLYEGLYGERPFQGRTIGQLELAHLGGVGRAPSGVEVPARLRAIVLRGLQSDPDERWPSMDALLEELRKLVAPRTRRWLALGVGAGLTAVGLGVGVVQYAEFAARCDGAQAQLEGTWDEERRQQVKEAVVGTGLSYAPDTWVRLEQRLDDYAAAWADKHTLVCEATSLRHEQSPEVMDLRMECLRRRRVALREAVGVLAEADETRVENAVSLVAGLPGLSRCDDVEVLQADLPPPEGQEVVEQVRMQRDWLAEARALEKAGVYGEALAVVEPVLLKAETLEYAPLLAEALLVRGALHSSKGQYLRAEQDLEQAFALAAEHGHDAVEARAVATLTAVVGTRLARHEQGLWWGKMAVPLARGPEIEPKIEAHVLNNIGNVLSAQNRLPEAVERHRDALAIRERALGPTHPDVAVSLNNIGVALRQQGELEDALPPLQRALAIKEEALGPRHPSVAHSVGGIGAVLQAQGKFEEALTHYQQALAIRTEALGSEHPYVADSLNDVGNILQIKGKPQEALSHHRRALAIRERVLSPEHPDIADSLTNVGNILHRQGKLEEALTHHQRALDIFEAALGLRHPRVANSLSGIGHVLGDQGKVAEALIRQQRALDIFETELGPTHPDVAKTLNSIGHLLGEQGKLAEALAHHQRALAIREETLGPAHLDVAYSLNNISVLVQRQGKPQEAKSHLQRALAIFEDALGPTHPNVAAALMNIGYMLQSQGQLEEALTYHQRALAIFEDALGPAHPNVAIALTNIGFGLAKQGELPEAQEHFQRAHTILIGALGADHPRVAIALANLATVALDQHDIDAARTHAEHAVSILESAQVSPTELAQVRFLLARVLWADRADRRRARGLAQQARDAYAEHRADREDDLTEVDRWLAKHRVQ